MTVNNAIARKQYISAGATSTFSITFQFERDTDLKVYKTLSGAIPDPQTNILVYNEDYTVVGQGWGNETARYITLTTPTSTGDIITIIREMPISRETDFNVDGAFSSADLNDQFDDLVGMIQQIDTKTTQLMLSYINNQILNTDNLQNTIPKLPPLIDGVFSVWTADENGSLIAVPLTEDSGYSILRSQLANNESGTDGARLVGYENTDLPDPNTTVHAALDYVISTLPSGGDDIGDICWSFRTTKSGWLLMDNGTIGSATSSATHANSIYEDLFKVLWDSSNSHPEWFPVVPGPRGADAQSDWDSNKTIQLPQMNGRSMACAGANIFSSIFTTDFSVNNLLLTFGDTSNLTSGMVVRFTSTGTLPAGLLTATDYVITVTSATTVKFSKSGPDTETPSQNYTNSIYGILTGNGSGVHSMIVQYGDAPVLGEFTGYPNHILTLNELTLHQHSFSYSTYNMASYSFGDTPENVARIATTPSSVTAINGNSVAFSVIPPTIYGNAFIKI